MKEKRKSRRSDKAKAKEKVENVEKKEVKIDFVKDDDDSDKSKVSLSKSSDQLAFDSDDDDHIIEPSPISRTQVLSRRNTMRLTRSKNQHTEFDCLCNDCTLAGGKCLKFVSHIWMPERCRDCSHSVIAHKIQEIVSPLQLQPQPQPPLKRAAVSASTPTLTSAPTAPTRAPINREERLKRRGSLKVRTRREVSKEAPKDPEAAPEASSGSSKSSKRRSVAPKLQSEELEAMRVTVHFLRNENQRLKQEVEELKVEAEMKDEKIQALEAALHEVNETNQRSMEAPPLDARREIESKEGPEESKEEPKEESEESEEDNEEIKEKNKRQRMMVEEELMATERRYVDGLRLLVSHFRDPMVKEADRQDDDGAAPPLFQRDELAKIFSSVDVVLNISRTILAQLEEAAGGGEPLAGVFVKMGQFLKAYRTYCVNYEVAMLTIMDIRKRKEARQFLDRLTAKVAPRRDSPFFGFDLPSFLITPVQRIPRYIALLEQMQRFTSRRDPARPLQAQAIALVNEIMKSNELAHQKAVRMQSMFELRSRLAPGKWDGELVTTTRELLLEERVQVDQKRQGAPAPKERVIFLLNDGMLMAKQQRTSRKDDAAAEQLVTELFLDVSQTFLFEEDAQDPRLLHLDSHKTFLNITFSSEKARDQWMKAIRKEK